MASTNKTTNLELPQWQLTDKPEMADFNDAFGAIDTGVAGKAASNHTHSGTYDPAGTGASAVSSHNSAAAAHGLNAAATVAALPMTDPGNYFAGDDKLGTQMQAVGSQLAQIDPLYSSEVGNTKNLYNSALAQDGYYYNSVGGALVAYANSAVSGKIPVKPNTRYTLSIDAGGSGVLHNNLHAWGQDGSWIKILASGERVYAADAKSVTLTTQSDCYYLSNAFLFGVVHTAEQFAAMAATIQMEEGGGVTDFVAYESTKLFEDGAIAKKYSGKKWAVMGDSLTEWNTTAMKTYHDYVSGELGLTVSNMGLSGSGFMKLQGTSQAFYQRIPSVASDAHVVTIMGSGNDLSLIASLGTETDVGTTTICGCINATIDALYTALPTVRLGIIAPTPWGTVPPTTPGNNMELYCDKLQAICKMRGIPYLDLYHSSGLRPWEAAYLPLMYSRDAGGSTHPDENGHKLFAPQVREFVKALIQN